MRVAARVRWGCQVGCGGREQLPGELASSPWPLKTNLSTFSTSTQAACGHTIQLAFRTRLAAPDMTALQRLTWKECTELSRSCLHGANGIARATVRLSCGARALRARKIHGSPRARSRRRVQAERE
eukprot:COSAG04_NODE_19549_length_413_cov_1.449045_1_plen_125_part_01